jgi:hypothetical protein|tara:strand:- start:207 stop:401 length:195 start_codon:yes stop_codon:yes gene_type:complete
MNLFNLFNQSTKDNTNDGFDHLRHNRPLRSITDIILEREPRIFTPEGADILMTTPKSITAHGEI